jgi:peptidoglycan/LPS O-acetylase OafA/YrhL
MTYLLALLSRGIDKLQATLPPNRLVVLLTPLAFMPAAGFITAYVAQHFPGLPTFSTPEVAGFFAAGALAAFVKAYKWLDGWQAHERAILGFYGAEQSLAPILERIFGAADASPDSDEPLSR